MSKQVDERVVSLQFDNKRFESNVAQSMSTLDKLKQKLNLKGASKGFEEVNAAAKKVDMKGLASNVETVRARFSALDVVGVTALANIANSAVNAGKQLVSSLTIAPVKDGFSEYEMTLNAIQTTMAGTGKTAKEVEKELKKLDEYADKTVYSTADMLNNLPKFTNAGVELENATKAMIGIANATALAGGDAGKASIAFYNLGQAIGTGYLTRMDYNSINNAGIATMEWKNQMVDAAIAAGTLTKAGDDLYEAGGKTFTLQQLFIDGLQEQWATTDVMMKVFGDYGDETTKIGEKAYAAAQDIKTFSMMMDSLKATAGTGWKDTWQIIFGDLDAAKVMWTRLTNFISGIITKMADIRNAILDSALGRGFSSLGEKIQGVVNPVKNAIDTAKGALKDYNTIVDEIIAGKWGNAPTRWQDLTKAGYDWAHAQNLVNERLGDSTRHATNYKEAQDGLNKSQEKSAETQKKLSKADADRIADLCKLTDAQLLELGYTKEQIKAFRELEKTAKKLGMPISEFLANIDKIDGRWLLVESFANLGKSLSGVFKAMSTAWQEIFNPEKESMIQKIADKLFDLIAAFHRFSRSLLLTDSETGKLNENGEKLKRTFKGIFAIFDIVATIVGGPLKIAFKILTQLLGAFDLNLLDLTAFVGDAIVKFRDWLDGVLDFTEVFKKIAPYIKKAVNAVKDWIAETKPLEKAAEIFKKIGSAIKEGAIAFKDSEFFKMGKNIIQGLIKGLKNGVGDVWDAITNLATKLIDKAKEVLGIHSPSTVFAAIGGFIVAGLVLGLTQGFPEVGTKLQNLINGVINFLKEIDFGAIFAGLLASGMLVVSFKLANALEQLTSPLEGIGDLIADIGKGLKKWFKASALKQTSEAVKNFAISIAILVASVYVLTKIKPGDLWGAIGAIAALSAILVVLSFAISKLNSMGDMSLDKTGLKVNKMTSQIIPIAFSLLLVAIAVKQLAKLNVNDLVKGGLAIVALGGVLVGIMAASKLLDGNVDGLGATLVKMSAALLLMIFTAKLAAGMSTEDMIRGGVAIIAFGSIIVGLMAATKLISGSKNVDKIGGAILKISAALLLMVVTAKIAANMSVEDLIKGTLAVAAFGGIVVGLMAATRLISGSKNIDKIGGAIFKISAALLLMLVTAKLAANMSIEDMVKGGLAIAAFGGIIIGLMAATKLLTGSKNIGKIGGAILQMAIAIGIMAATCALLGMLKLETLAKGVIAVGLFSAMIAGLILATKSAKDCKGNLIAVTVAIGVMALAVAALSFIDPGRLAAATAAIGILMGLFALLIKVAGTAKMALGPIITMTIVVGLLGAMIYILAKLPVESTLGVAASLSVLLVSMSASLVMLGIVGTLGPAAFIGLGALATLIVGLGALIIGIGALMDKFPQLEEFLNKGIPVLEKIGYALGSFFGNIIGGFMAGITSGLPEMGLMLSQFMVNAMPFIAGARMIDATTMDGVKTLAEVILILTAADVIQGLTSWLTGGSSIVSFGKEIAALGPYLKAFADSVVGIDGASIQAAANAAKALAEMTATIPNEGGVAAWFAGENSITKFASELPGLGTHLKMFSDNVTGVNAESITSAAEAAKALAEMTATIPNEGGVAAWFAGENSITKFASELPGLGSGLKGFSDNVAGINAESVNAAVSAAKAIVEMSSEIPNEGGVAAWFAGDNSIASFSSQLGNLGTAISTFATNVGSTNVENINKAVKATKALSAMLKTDISGSISVMKDFGKELISYGNKLSDFCKKMSKIKDESISSAIDKFKSIVNMGSTLSVDNISSLSKFSETLIKVAETGVKEFVSTLNSKTVKSDANEAISDLVSDTADKIETDSNKRKFKSAGKYLISGLAEGILANKPAATKAAQNVADAVEEIIRSAWEVNSPSKLFYRIALGIGEGIEYALGDSALGVKNSAGDLADTASSGFGNIMAKVYEVINSDMDMQPTIRPVLDLTDVNSGVSSIGAMLSGARTVSVNAAGIGAISANMANRQNGSDLASAINKLAKTNGKSGDTYNFNGFSYSEGSDVANAIQTLVRAAKIEGRT